MEFNNLGNQLNLFEKSIVKLIVAHQENQKILENYLVDEYEVQRDPNDFEKVDIIIVDEAGFGKHKQEIMRIKQSNISFFLPLILVTPVSPEKIPEKYMSIIDEVVQTPMKPRILSSRIRNLLNVRKLFLSTRIYQDLTDKNPVGIAMLLENQKIKYANKAFLEIMDETKEKVLDKEITSFIKNNGFIEQISKNEIRDKEKLRIELRVKEQKKWVEVRVSNIVYQNIRVKLLILDDVTKQKESEEEIKYLRFHDQLTGLYNRDYFMEESKRLDSNGQIPLTVIIGDINGLKLVNDVFGHEAGDRLIKNAGKIMKSILRDEDILARIGGDEFAILLPNTKEEGGIEVIRRINQRCTDFSGEGMISISFGVATKNDMKQNFDDVFKIADDYMYQKKTPESKQFKQKMISNIYKKLKNESDENEEHIENVKGLALKFAHWLNLSNEEKERLIILAESHDIGKISLTEERLTGTGKLSNREAEKLKTHTEYGYRISHSIPDLYCIADEILSHHERWDGEGYPQGLKGKSIPRLARIFTIVDHYDLLVKGRGVNNKASVEAALEEIKNRAGSQFDPDLVEEFIEMIKN